MNQPLAYVPPKLASNRTPEPKVLARGQKDNESSAKIRIPTPEELGIGSNPFVAGDEPLDWTMVERKLDLAGVTGYQMEKIATGYRFTCQLPTGPVSGRGATKNEAMRNALAQLR